MADLSWALHRKLLRAKDIGFNSEVYNWFKDADEFEGRKRLRDSLLIGIKDSRTTASFKIQYFREQVQRVHERVTIIGQPKTTFDENVQYKCMCFLMFRQNKAAVTRGSKPIEAEISFRLNETHKTITDAKINALATKIKNTLVTGNNGYKFNKGKYLGLYTDKENGYELRVYGTSPAESEQVVKKILSIQDHVFDNKYFRVTEPKRNSDNTPGSTMILNEPVKLPRWRPTATVEFSYADLLVHGIGDAINLVDLGGYRRRRKVINYV